MKLAWRLFWREWRGGELGLLLLALALGVAIVTGISLFTVRMQTALVGEAAVYLGADRVLQVSEPVPTEWLRTATMHRLVTARTAVFPTMVYAGDRMALCSLKAVSAGYPLRGELVVRKQGERALGLHEGPPPGHVWVDENLMGQLSVNVGDLIELGDRQWRIDAVLVREGDAGSSFYGMGPRVMMPDTELAATGLLMPGSRVEYRYLFAGNQADLEDFFNWLKPQLRKGQRIITLEDNQPGIAGALEKAGTFLRLAGALGVLLAALAGGFAAQRYCERHVDAIAALKTMGATHGRILTLLILQLVCMWWLATVVGWLAGAGLQALFMHAMSDWLPAPLPAAGWQPYLLGTATSLVSLLAFILPSFRRLLVVPPSQVFRSERWKLTLHWQDMPWILAGVIALLLMYSGSVVLVLYLLAGIGVLVLASGALAVTLLLPVRHIGMRASSAWQLGLASLRRRGAFSVLQVVVFSIGFMLLAIIVLLRTSLLTEWQAQIPPDAPNHFLINIPPDENIVLEQELIAAGLRTAGMYPMVKGRLVRINGVEATKIFDETVNEVYRELNLSWTPDLPDDNKIVMGTWFSGEPSQQQQVSVEQGLAKRLKITVGDKLVFRIGTDNVEVVVSSLRSLHWDRMTPNFYFLFAPGALDAYSRTWMTSVRVNDGQRAQLAKVLRQHPTVTAYPVEELIQRIRSITERASLAVELVLLLVLSAGILVLISCLRSSLDQRLHESALLRTLGASRQRVIGGLVMEFLLLGCLAGVLAAVGAELSCWALQTRLFQMSSQLHPWLWLGLPLLGASLIGSVGTLFCYRVVNESPVSVLRETTG